MKRKCLDFPLACIPLDNLLYVGYAPGGQDYTHNRIPKPTGAFLATFAGFPRQALNRGLPLGFRFSALRHLDPKKLD